MRPVGTDGRLQRQSARDAGGLAPCGATAHMAESRPARDLLSVSFYFLHRGFDKPIEQRMRQVGTDSR